MVTKETFSQLALSFPETTEQPHFDKISFRVGKKIFATLHAERNEAYVKLSLIDQDAFSSFNRSIIYPIPNKWGSLGWTQLELARLPEEMTMDLLTQAYCEVAPKKLAEAVRK